MKTKLLCLSFFLTTIGFAQAPIASFYGSGDASYIVVTSNPAISQNAAGANVTWNFNSMAAAGSSIDTNALPNASDLSSYPGTTAVVTTVSAVGSVDAQLKLFTKQAGTTVSITGVENAGLTLNFNTNNATLGAFPMSYGFTNSDVTSGNYVNGTYSGTFTGTINTSVDAWGTLNMNNVGAGSYSGTVTRLKTVQNISLNYSVFSNVGTVIITTYSYYDATNIPTLPKFRTTTTAINVPLLSINETLSQMDRFEAVLLGTKSSEFQASRVQIAPNPVQGVLTIYAENLKVNSVSVSDITGKVILKSDANSNAIDVSQLQKGVYFAQIVTDQGVSTQKFVKQ